MRPDVYAGRSAGSYRHVLSNDDGPCRSSTACPTRYVAVERIVQTSAFTVPQTFSSWTPPPSRTSAVGPARLDLGQRMKLTHGRLHPLPRANIHREPEPCCRSAASAHLPRRRVTVSDNAGLKLGETDQVGFALNGRFGNQRGMHLVLLLRLLPGTSLPVSPAAIAGGRQFRRNETGLDRRWTRHPRRPASSSNRDWRGLLACTAMRRPSAHCQTPPSVWDSVNGAVTRPQRTSEPASHGKRPSSTEVWRNNGQCRVPGPVCFRLRQ